LAKLRKGLLDYCRQDTLGLVRLLEKLRIAGYRFNPNVTLNSVALTTGITDRSSLDNSTMP
jgi:hypothetical protein